MGDKVRFLASDSFLPTAEALNTPPPGDAELEGTIVDFSDSGSKLRAYAVIDVIRKQMIVVPVEKLQLIGG